MSDYRKLPMCECESLDCQEEGVHAPGACTETVETGNLCAACWGSRMGREMASAGYHFESCNEYGEPDQDGDWIRMKRPTVQ